MFPRLHTLLAIDESCARAVRFLGYIVLLSYLYVCSKHGLLVKNAIRTPELMISVLPAVLNEYESARCRMTTKGSPSCCRKFAALPKFCLEDDWWTQSYIARIQPAIASSANWNPQQRS